LHIFGKIKREIDFTRSLKRLVNNVGDISPESDVLLTDDIEASVDAHRGNIAFYFKDKAVSYDDFDARANRIAHWALDQGLQAGDTAAIFMENCPDYVATWFGLSKIGVISALINTNLDGAGLAHCLNIVAPKAVIAAPGLAPRVAGLSGQLDGNPALWDWTGAVGSGLEEALSHQSDERPSREHRAHLRGHDLIFYIYTSGTTGLPKAAKITHVRTRRSFRISISACDIVPEDRIYITLPLYHVTGGFLGLGGAILSGASAILRERFSASHYWDDVNSYQATVIVYIGELCRYLLNQPDHPGDRGHSVRTGIGNGLRSDIWQKFIDRFQISKLVEVYGSTEGNVFLLNFDGKVGAVGRIPKYLEKQFGDVRFAKFDIETEEPVRGPDGFCIRADVGEAGEVLGRIDVNGPSDFSGYQDKAATEKKILRDAFEPGDMWFRTGDLMSRDKEGYIYFHDRIGDTFRWKGENVATNEVAEIFCQYPGVETANIYGVAIEGTDGRAGMAAITVGDDFDIAGLREFLAGALPSYAVPVFVRIQQEAETTGTFKYRKVDLVRQGFDVAATNDPIWYCAQAMTQYARLAAPQCADIAAGKVKF